MPRNLRSQDAGCSIAQAAAVIGDRWSLLIVREVARGHRRFEALTGELALSRKVLTERLNHLVDHRVLARTPYPEHPARHEYVLTDAGWALAPTLIAMQDWADHWLLGDGALTGMPAAGVAVHGVSTQLADEQRAFAEAEGIPFPLLSDVDLRLAAALRLPTFRAGGTMRLKRLILVVDRLRVVRHVVFPVQDIPAAVAEALEAGRALT